MKPKYMYGTLPESYFAEYFASYNTTQHISTSHTTTMSESRKVFVLLRAVRNVNDKPTCRVSKVSSADLSVEHLLVGYTGKWVVLHVDGPDEEKLDMVLYGAQESIDRIRFYNIREEAEVTIEKDVLGIKAKAENTGSQQVLVPAWQRKDDDPEGDITGCSLKIDQDAHLQRECYWWDIIEREVVNN
ncbi:hypothetical protein BDV96DRAFT_673588 [Lophiotrema nucula]|uniref:Uncharacterized protein n=1 Tax=Lophiotrema nucula TaxID=690887 RepID=A0A6A5YIY4_9PLEO|nr:hypothetical protein BDV96DRAFT_673588 [Lophiotrema nucula]